MRELIIIIIILTIALIIGAYIISPPQAEDIEAPRTDIKAGVGELCKTATLNIPCEKGLQCLSKDGRSNFEPKKTNGYCTNTSS